MSYSVGKPIWQTTADLLSKVIGKALFEKLGALADTSSDEESVILQPRAKRRRLDRPSLFSHSSTDSGSDSFGADNFIVGEQESDEESEASLCYPDLWDVDPSDIPVDESCPDKPVCAICWCGIEDFEERHASDHSYNDCHCGHYFHQYCSLDWYTADLESTWRGIEEQSPACDCCPICRSPGASHPIDREGDTQLGYYTNYAAFWSGARRYRRDYIPRSVPTHYLGEENYPAVS